MTHEDMFRLHLSGAGKYKGNQLVISTYTTVEFIDGFDKYIVREYWDANKIYSRAEYSRGKMHGKYEDYFSTGGLCSTHNYINGERNGKHFDYYGTGETYIFRNWTNDELHGEYVIYNRDGSVRLSRNYAQGVSDDG